ncbi:hypothetical protein QY97_01264 [Bacillus thermotolerans]|nr:hypothetical protein QY97_01264 [Bacillus thermotolerans]
MLAKDFIALKERGTDPHSFKVLKHSLYLHKQGHAYLHALVF